MIWRGGRLRPADRRGQLVLVAAGVIAVALVPMLAAYLQLGYAADVRTTAQNVSPTEDAIRALEGAVSDAAAGVPGSYDWSERSTAADGIRSGLDPRIETVETALVDQGIVRSVAYNDTVASDVASSECPSGPARQFGNCIAEGGVVVQERDGQVHVLGVAVDVSSMTAEGRSSVTVYLPVVS